MPDGRILDAVLASRGTGSAAASGAARGAGTAGTGGAGGLGALKIGLIALAAVVVVGLGAFGAVQIASHSSDSQQSPIGNLVGQKEPGMPAETEEPSAPPETEAPSAPVETEAPSAPVETEEPSAPQETEAPSAPPEMEQDVNDIIDEEQLQSILDNYYIMLSMFYQGNLDFMEDYMRPKNKNTFNVNGEDMSAETAKEHKITLDLENGDTIDGITSKNNLFDVFKLWGTHQKTEMDDTSIVITFKDDENYDYFCGEQLNSFKGTEIKVWLKYDWNADTMVPHKAVIEFTAD